MASLYLFSTEYQLDVVLDLVAGSSTDCILIALTVKASCIASSRGVEHNVIDDFYSNEVGQIQGERNYEKAARLCKAIDTLACVDRTQLVPDLSADYYFSYFKRLLDNITIASQELNAIFSEVKPDQVICFSYSIPTPDELGRVRLNMLLESVPLLCNSLDIPFMRLAEGGPKKKTISLYSRVRNLLISARQMMRQLTARLFPRTLTIVSFQHWDREAARYLSDSGISILAPPQTVPNSTQKTPNALNESIRKTLTPFFNIGGINFFSIIEKTFQYYLTDFQSENLANLEVMTSFLKRVAADAVASVAITSPPAITLAIAAKKLGLPVILLQHGGGNGVFNSAIIWHYDIYFADVYFSYGEGVNSFFQKNQSPYLTESFTPKPKMYAIGRSDIASILKASEKINVKKNQSKTTVRKKVLFLMDSYLGPLRNYTRQKSSDFWHWHLQKKVISLCLEQPGVDLVVRSSPSSVEKGVVERWLNHSQAQNWECDSSTPLPSLLVEEYFDLIICEAPATALLQAAVTKSPLVVLFDDLYIDLIQDAETLMQKRMTISKNLNEYLRDIKKFLDAPELSDFECNKLLNREFIEAYAHPGSQVPAKQHLAEAMLDCVSGLK